MGNLGLDKFDLLVAAMIHIIICTSIYLWKFHSLQLFSY